MRKLLFTAATVCLLGSCGIYNRYERPELSVAADSLYRTEVKADTVSSVADLSWKEFFTDPYLQALIQQALEMNTDLRIAYLKVKEMQAQLVSAKLAYLPSVQLDPQGTLSSQDGSKTSKTYEVGASASWEIDIFGKLTNAKRSARAALEESDAYRQAVQTQLIATVADSYYTLLMLDEQERITSETVASWKDYVHSLYVLMQAGEADRATVSQAEASRASAEASLLSLQQQIAETENSLSSVLGEVSHRIQRGNLSNQRFPQRLSTGVPLELLSRRPDIRQAEAALKQAFYATNQARAAFYPSIMLSGSAGWTNNGGAVVTNPGSWLLQAIGSLVQPIFNRGQNIANLKTAKAQQEEALLTFRQSLLDAGKEVNNALIQWQTARERIRLDEEQVKHLQTTVHDTELLMEYGTTNYLQVLTARQSLLSARLDCASDCYQEIQGVINLYHALGGGAEADL